MSDIIPAVFITAILAFLYITAMRQNARAYRAEAALRRIEATLDACTDALALRAAPEHVAKWAGEIVPLANAFMAYEVGTVAMIDLEPLTVSQLRDIIYLTARPIPYVITANGKEIAGMVEYDSRIVAAAREELERRCPSNDTSALQSILNDWRTRDEVAK